MYHYKLYHDAEHQNGAKIETGLKILPYAGSPKAMPAARLTLYAMYDDNFVYHVSTHETEEEAIKKMNSCGSNWREV